MILAGKTIDFLGDSITEGAGVQDIPNNRYDNILKRTCNLQAVYNYGIGGTRIAHQHNPSEFARQDLDFCARSYDMCRDADIIIVYGGTNDYGHGDAPFGEVGDSTRETFCGSVDYLLRALKRNYPQAQIVILTPARRKGDLAPSEHIRKSIQGYPLLDYVCAIKEIAKSNELPVLDLYHKLPINPNESDDLQKYTTDGLHLNDEGHKLLAETIKNFLESL